MCYGQNEMLMPHSLISLKTLLSSLCRKKAEACAVAIFIIAIFIGIIGHKGDSTERMRSREVIKKCFWKKREQRSVGTTAVLTTGNCYRLSSFPSPLIQWFLVLLLKF